MLNDLIRSSSSTEETCGAIFKPNQINFMYTAHLVTTTADQSAVKMDGTQI